MIFDKIVLGILNTNTYILADDDSKQGVIVDIGGDLDKLKQKTSDMGVKIEKIILTHGHLDHMLESNQARDYYKACVYLNEEDKDLFKDQKIRSFYGDNLPSDLAVDVFIKDGDIITFGRHQIKVIHTPGHTQGSVCLLADDRLLITGDTLFKNTIGRTDHPGGDTLQEIESIKNKLLTLPDSIEVFPAHGNNTTIGLEKANNTYLK
ncbi:MAG: MBL fold metallo-hydrolase [Chloroflexi bacterium]|nr:MBL fold metallo-hydrolase [Chloroflexota bacterium]